MKPREHPVFRFDEFTLVPSERLFLHGARAVPMTGKAFDLLAELVQNAGHLVTKDALLQAVWPGLVVEEVNLSVNISAVRKALSLAPGGGEWIETIPRQGYRFNAPVQIGDIATVNLAELRGLASSYRSESIPEAKARGIPRRAALYAAAAIVAAVAVLLAAYRWLPREAPYPSVAILPFTVDNPSNAYLADGLVEGVVDGLTRVRTLRVIPRASAFRFKGTAFDPVAAGRTLDTATVLGGSLASAGDGVKVRVELMDVARNAQVWSASYEAARGDIPRLEMRVMNDVAAALRIESLAGIEHRARAPAAPNVDAYQAYLQGRFLWNQRSEAGLTAAVAHFRRAIELDPAFARAYAALADAHTALGYLGYQTPVSTFPVARPYALKALELDPSLAQAHASLAYIKFYFDWDWAGAQQEFRRALELDPNDPTSHQWYAVYLLAAGRPREAFGEVEAAHRLDPLSLAINTDIGFHHYYNARYPEAIAQLQAVLGMKSDFPLAHLWLGRTYLQLGRYDEALAETAFAESKAREWPVIVTARGFAYGSAGRTNEARAVLTEMDALSKHRFVTAYGMALVHAGLNQKDEAFRWLEAAFAERSHWLVWLRLDPRWRNLRDDPRFAAMVERMKYPA